MKATYLKILTDAKNSIVGNPHVYNPGGLMTFKTTWQQLVAQLPEREANELLIAVHEAGHAVMSWVVDYPFEHVTIIPNADEGSLGHVLHAPFPKHLASDIDTGFPCKASIFYMDRQMIISLAGYAAEVLHLDPKKPDSEQSRYDFENTVTMTQYRFNTIEETEKYINDMIADAKDSIDTFYTYVQVLAIELLEKRKMAHDEMISLFMSLPPGS